MRIDCTQYKVIHVQYKNTLYTTLMYVFFDKGDVILTFYSFKIQMNMKKKEKSC